MAALRGVPFLVPRGWFCLAADLSAIFQLQGWTCVESSLGDLPGSPVVGTFRFHCSGCRFHPFQGTKIQCAAQCGQKKKKKPPPTKPVLGLRLWEVLVLGGERPYPAQLQKPRPSLLRLLRP